MTDSDEHANDFRAEWTADDSHEQPEAGHAGPEPGMADIPPAGASWAESVPSDTVELGATSPARATGRTRIVVAVAAAVAVLAVVGVVVAINSGGKGSAAQGSAAQVVAAAVRKSAGFTSVSGTFSVQITGPGFPGISASGTDAETRHPLQASMQMTESVGSQVLPMSAVVTGKSIYFKFGAVSGLPQAMIGKWIEISFSQVPGGNALGAILRGVPAENPSVQMQALRAAQNVRSLGTQVIAGVQTTEYEGSFTEAALLKALSASVRAQLAPELKGLTGLSHFRAWIDGQGQLRKMTLQEKLGAGSETFSMTVTSYNQAVTITIPPAGQVLHLPSSALGGA